MASKILKLFNQVKLWLGLVLSLLNFSLVLPIISSAVVQVFKGLFSLLILFVAEFLSKRIKVILYH